MPADAGTIPPPCERGTGERLPRPQLRRVAAASVTDKHGNPPPYAMKPPRPTATLPGWTKYDTGSILAWMRHFSPCLLRTHHLFRLPHALLALAALFSLAVADLQAAESASSSSPFPLSPALALLADTISPSAATLWGAGRCELQCPISAPAPATSRVMVVGDSFAVGIGLTLKQSLAALGPVAMASRGKVSSGLNSPRFYDWEKELTRFLTTEGCDVLVVMLGGNDAKNGCDTPEWSKDFQDKAKRFLDIADAHKVSVYWVGLPPMREKSYSQRAAAANVAMSTACAKAASCRFIDSWNLFADASGRFCSKKKIAGKTISLRGHDGVHLTMAGYRLLTDRLATGMNTLH